jgi:HK97 family phage major capsid protein
LVIPIIERLINYNQKEKRIMFIAISFLKDYESHKAGDCVEVSQELFEKLHKDGIAERKSVVEATAAAAKEAEETRKKETVEIVANTVKAVVQELSVESNGRKTITFGDMKDRAADDAMGGFKHATEYLVAVKRASANGSVADERLLKMNKKFEHQQKSEGINEAIDSEGGFLVPDEYRATLWEKTYEAETWVNKIFRLPVSGTTIRVPYLKENSRVDGSRHGGIRVYRTEEGGQKTKSQPKFGKLGLTVTKQAGLCYMTDEILSDSAISIEPLVNKLFSEAFAFALKRDVIRGSGAGEPLGILNSPALVTKQRATASQIAAIDVVTLYARLYAPSRPNAVWLYNVDCLEQLTKMYLATGSNAGQLIWTPAGGWSGRPFDTIFGIPAMPSEICSTLGTEGDLILADFTQYILAEKAGGVKVASSIHLRFDYDETAYRFVLRNDGNAWWNAPLTPYQGTVTQSPFLTLTDAA